MNYNKVNAVFNCFTRCFCTPDFKLKFEYFSGELHERWSPDIE